MGRGKQQQTYDAIVIGSGISGGWAAKELCDAGLKTLVLERGRDVPHGAYPTATMNPWDFPMRDQLSAEEKAANPIADRCYAYNESTKHFFVRDADHPYVQEKPFDWIRGYQTGGKSLIWARQTQRWSRFEFEAPKRDGFAVPWPIGYEDLAPWYGHVEKFVGISGNKDGLEQLPDSEVLPPWELNCVEKHIQSQVRERYADRHVIIGRCAHLTEPQAIHLEQGRGKCQARHLCYRGCPYGAYFSSNSSTLPWAARTGNLTVKNHAVVESIMYDEHSARASGVRVIDAEDGSSTEYFSKAIFVNAGALNSNLILLNSTSSRFPQGLGNDSGLLGRYIAFHNYRGNILADYPGFEDRYYKGRRPTTAFMPSFKNVFRRDSDFDRGYMVAFSAARRGWNRALPENVRFGESLKSELAGPGGWQVFMMMQGETIPKYENHVRLSETKVDPWGIPQLVISVDYDDNDEAMIQDFLVEGATMLEQAGCVNIRPYDDGRAPGLDIHQMGGVRMGSDPKTSLCNRWNQLHACKNVYVTDGACMTSVGNQNPSLTFMALTARAADHAVQQLKAGAF
ncbi:MAG: GMC family oxidoreductase [Saprospiraceae bacterium]|nr:GMC family oxidoreductase [Saprospiraceae bacterium]